MKGVVTYLQGIELECVRLVMDDVSSLDKEAVSWKAVVPFTSNEYPALDLKSLNLSKEQLAQIGENLVIRLLALNGALK